MLLYFCRGDWIVVNSFGAGAGAAVGVDVAVDVIVHLAVADDIVDYVVCVVDFVDVVGVGVVRDAVAGAC